jgi:hypothetical protein
VVPQSGAKDHFYCTVYYITLNYNCKAWGVSKNLKKIVEDRVRSQKLMQGDLSVIVYILGRKLCLKITN